MRTEKDELAKSIIEFTNCLVKDNEDQDLNLYKKVIGFVEERLFEEVIKLARFNQNRAAEMLGISRPTLRKKLSDYFNKKYFPMV